MADITIRIPDRAVKAAAVGVGAVFLLWGVSQLWASGMFRPKYQVEMFVPDSVGIQVGAPVRVDGVSVGRVSAVSLAANPADSNRRIEVVLRIEKRFEDLIRNDSTASLFTEGLLGVRYVNIQRGFGSSPVPPGGEIRAVPAKDVSLTDVIGALGQAGNCHNEEKGSVQQSPTVPQKTHSLQ